MSVTVTSAIGTIVATTDRVISEVTSYLREQGYSQVLVPQIGQATPEYPGRTKFRLSFRDVIAESPQGATDHLVRVLPEVPRVFALTNVLRPEPDERRARTHLHQYHLFQIAGAGDLSVAVSLLEGMLGNLRERLPESAGKAAGTEGPLPRIRFDEIAKRTDLATVPSPTTGEMPRVVVNRPMIVEWIPLTTDPGLIDCRVHDGSAEAFEFIVPSATEVACGGVLETDPSRLRAQLADSEYRRAMLAAGYRDFDEDVRSYASDVAALRGAHFIVNIGLERLVQFLIGADDIREAAIYPMPAGELTGLRRNPMAYK